MKTKIVILLMLVTLSSCRQLNELTTPKPVQIDGLGSLSSLAGKILDKKQLTKVIKAAASRNVVSGEDAGSMLEIYRKYSSNFLNASTMVFDNDEITSKDDVENFLSLILQYDNLRSEVNETTEEAITREIKKTARFDDSKISGLGENAGNLAGSYVNAYNKAVAKDSKEKRTVSNNQQGRNKINIINGYEQAALEITEGKKEGITPKEKEKAEQFINDLKEYSDSLSAEWKILDADSKLISPAKMSAKQKASMEDIFSNETNSAGDRLSNLMRPTYNELRISTEQQVKGL